MKGQTVVSLPLTLSACPSELSHAVHATTVTAPPEVCESLQECLELRDKYISASLQRLGDNPRDHDGAFHGFANPSHGDVIGARPGAPLDQIEATESKWAPWRIYPRPPPPNWHWTDRTRLDIAPSEKEEEFEFSQVPIPGPDERGWTFKVDRRGVIQVYDSACTTVGHILEE
jgi:AMP deaminase